MASGVFAPGVLYILKSIPKLLLPPGLAYLACDYAASLLGKRVPLWGTVVASLLASPVWALVRAVYTHFREEREIRALGAVRVPVVQGRWPGNLDLLLGRLKQGKDGYPFDVMESMIRRYGKTFNTRILGEDRIVTSDPAHIQRMFATDFEGWEKGDNFRSSMGAIFGLGVFTSDGELWKFHRQMTRPFFSRDRISNLDIFSRHSEDALGIIRASQGVAFDYQDVVFRFTLDSAAEFLFGVRVDSLRGETTDLLGPALSRLQHAMAQRSRTAPIWPLFEMRKDKTTEDLKLVHGFIGPIIEAALDKKKSGLKTNETLLDELVEVTDDPKLIMDQTLNVLFAGRDTTAATVTFLTYCLATHPPVLERLREEILAQIGEARTPTFEDIKQMKLLRAAINETLRLFPPVPGNVRYSIKSTTLPSSIPGGKPFYIPARAKVPFSLMTMHKSKEYWGEDADLWDPDRFLDERNQRVVANPFIFLPFSAGPRICLGQQFAYQEISFFIIRLLQTFQSLELASDAMPPDSLPPASWATGKGRKAIEKIRPKSDLTMSVQGGLWLRLRPSKSG
ncbi:cytochrome P450 monooxygenase [Mycena albidolilacea]|uniref:Cytochrome P450 monooxygenase n=1 Tax=Mycena albidolilacea TaxID=1033008 RepID=A0AAD7EV58_9AGAR|nr:cytochrome P450 monooxygenase [Mycena albidolilacea]